MRCRIVLGWVGGAMSVCAPAGFGSVILFQQAPPVGGTAVSISISTGGNPFSFANRRAADNFTLGDLSDVTSLRFWGGDESDAPSPPLRNLRGFNIQVFAADPVGNPGPVLFDSGLVPLASTSPTREGTLLVGLNLAPMYRFDYTLPAPLRLQPDTTYFLSVAGVVFNPVDATNEAWLWAAGPVGDTNIWQDRFDGQGYLPRTLSRRNAAFVLSGVVVPEPGVLAVLPVGLLLLRRRPR